MLIAYSPGWPLILLLFFFLKPRKATDAYFLQPRMASDAFCLQPTVATDASFLQPRMVSDAYLLEWQQMLHTCSPGWPPSYLQPGSPSCLQPRMASDASIC